MRSGGLIVGPQKRSQVLKQANKGVLGSGCVELFARFVDKVTVDELMDSAFPGLPVVPLLVVADPECFNHGPVKQIVIAEDQAIGWRGGTLMRVLDLGAMSIGVLRLGQTSGPIVFGFTLGLWSGQVVLFPAGFTRASGVGSAVTLVVVGHLLLLSNRMFQVGRYQCRRRQPTLRQPGPNLPFMLS